MKGSRRSGDMAQAYLSVVFCQAALLAAPLLLMSPKLQVDEMAQNQHFLPTVLGVYEPSTNPMQEMLHFQISNPRRNRVTVHDATRKYRKEAMKNYVLENENGKLREKVGSLIVAH